MGKWRWGTTILIIMVIIIIMNIISTMTIMTIRWSHNHCRNPNNKTEGLGAMCPARKTPTTSDARDGSTVLCPTVKVRKT